MCVEVSPGASVGAEFTLSVQREKKRVVVLLLTLSGSSFKIKVLWISLSIKMIEPHKPKGSVLSDSPREGGVALSCVLVYILISSPLFELS